MAFVFAKRSYDLLAYDFHEIESTSRLVLRQDTTFRVNGTDYPDRVEAITQDEGSILFGSNSIPEDATFLRAEFTGIFHSSDSSASDVWAGIQGINLEFRAIYEAWTSPRTTDDRQVLARALSGDDRFELSRGADRASGFAGIDRIFGYGGNDRLDGGAGDDILHGGRGADRLEAGSGADRLVGGLGRDLHLGGRDSLGDTFVFGRVEDSLPGDQKDVIANFTSGADRISLRGIDANSSTTGVNEAFRWSDGVADDHAVWWRPAGDGVILRADVNGDTVADFAIALRDLDALGAGDVLL